MVSVLFCIDIQLSQRYHFMVSVQHWMTSSEDGTEETVQRYVLALSAVLQSHLCHHTVPEHPRTDVCT